MGSRYERALVTGASSGIGRAIAVELASQGVHLVVAARDEQRLQDLAAEVAEAHGVDVEVLPADLATEAGRGLCVRRLEDHDVPVDLLVNNAGLVVDEQVADSDPEGRTLELEVNVVALTRLAVAAARVFRDRGHGGIANVASATAFFPLPGQATYAAGKAYVLSFSEALHMELAGTGVHVSVVCPGFTRTEIFDRADLDVSGVPSPMWMTAEQVARATVRGVETNDVVVTPGSANQALRLAARLTPTPLLRRLAPTLERLGLSG